MNIKKIIFLIFIFTSVPTGHAYPPTSVPFGIFNRSPVGNFKLTEIPPYKDNYEEALKYTILFYSKNNSKNRICMTGYNWEDKSRSAIIFWHAGDLLFHWTLEDFDTDYYYKSLLMGFSRSLSQSFFPQKYLDEHMGMQAAYSLEGLNELWKDCQTHGEFITIDEFPSPQNCNYDPDSDDEYDIKEVHLCDAIDSQRGVFVFQVWLFVHHVIKILTR